MRLPGAGRDLSVEEFWDCFVLKNRAIPDDISPEYVRWVKLIEWLYKDEGHTGRVASRMGVSRKTIYNWIHKYGLEFMMKEEAGGQPQIRQAGQAGRGS